MNTEELGELKHKDLETYLILKYGSMHGGFIAWADIQEAVGAADRSVNKYFDFLDIMLDAQSRGLT